eukprot:scaffold109090_cov39-Phaeocystis_antarctica.AAC.1
MCRRGAKQTTTVARARRAWLTSRPVPPARRCSHTRRRSSRRSSRASPSRQPPALAPSSPRCRPAWVLAAAAVARRRPRGVAPPTRVRCC